MATYKEIFGKQIKFLSSDPANEATGQIWYNSTSGTFKSVVTTEAWSSSAPLGTARYLTSAFGSQTAAVAAAGLSGGTYLTNTEEYNGVGWATGTSYPTGTSGGGVAGTSTAGLVGGGNTPPFTTAANEFDGSSWTATGVLPTAADNIGSCGHDTQTNVIWALGRIPSSGNAGTNTSVTYNGASFSGGPTLNTARMFGANMGAGTGTAGLVFGGFIDPSPNAMTNTEEYNGASWTAGNVLNNPSGLNTGFGIQTNAVAQCNPGTRVATERYDGTSWTNLPNLSNTSGGYTASSGSTGSAGFITSQLDPGWNATEEWNSTGSVITAAAWASGGSLGSARYAMSGVGPQTAALGAMGYSSSGKPASWKYTEEYNGTSWAEQADMSVARFSGGAFGTQTAAVFAGGNLDPGLSNAVEEYNGASWTAGTVLPAVRSAAPGFGVETAGVICGGSLPTATDTSLEYNGASWAAGGTMPTVGGGECTGSGIITAGLFVLTEPAPVMGAAYEYDGTNWTVGGVTIAGLPGRGAATAGAQDAGLIFGGGPATSTLTEGYDGTAWSTRPSLATGRRRVAGAGTSTAGLAFGGRTPPTSAGSTATEEFTGETSAVNYKTITTS